jgi:hypothetical protein
MDAHKARGRADTFPCSRSRARPDSERENRKIKLQKKRPRPAGPPRCPPRRQTWSLSPCVAGPAHPGRPTAPRPPIDPLRCCPWCLASSRARWPTSALASRDLAVGRPAVGAVVRWGAATMTSSSARLDVPLPSTRACDKVSRQDLVSPRRSQGCPREKQERVGPERRTRCPLAAQDGGRGTAMVLPDPVHLTSQSAPERNARPSSLLPCRFHCRGWRKIPKDNSRTAHPSLPGTDGLRALGEEILEALRRCDHLHVVPSRTLKIAVTVIRRTAPAQKRVRRVRATVRSRLWSIDDEVADALKNESPSRLRRSRIRASLA